jgi:ribosomal protein L29
MDALSPEEIRQRLHELRVRQIELEMQNEELRRAQAELDALCAHMRKLNIQKP